MVFFDDRLKLKNRDGLVLYLLISELDLDVSLSFVLMLVRSSLFECDALENMADCLLPPIEKNDDRPPVVFELNKLSLDEYSELFEPELLDLLGLNFDRKSRDAELVFSLCLSMALAAIVTIALLRDSSFCLSYSADALKRLHLISLLILNLPNRFSKRLVSV